MSTILKLLSASVLVLAFIIPVSAQDAEGARGRPAETQPIFVSTDVLVGCKAQGPGKDEDVVGDALIEASSGRIVGLIMESGVVSSFENVRWNAAEKGFTCLEHAGRATGAVDAASPRGEQGTNRNRQTHPQSVNGTFLLSSVVSYPLMGYERDDEGAREDTKLGSVGGAFIDTESGHVAYLTTSVGGVLGIGAESRVIPWSAVTIAQDAEGHYRFRSSITAERLESAPKFGEGPQNLNNPEYRDTLCSYYGTKRADFEPASSDNVGLVPVDEMIGATIVRGAGENDALADLILDPEGGQVTLALCRKGDVVPVDALHWDAREKHFRVSSDAQIKKTSPDTKLVLASAVADFDVMCAGEECGDLEDIYFDTSTCKLTYLSIDCDGVRVLPWSAVSLNTSGEEPRIELNCSRRFLESAPELDGEVGATIYSPAFRERVAALREQPQSDKENSHE